MVLSSDTSIYVQIKERIENSILYGELKEEDRAPSMNELASAYFINPATAGKGLNLLVDEGVLYKKRGIGMFVKKGAREKIIAHRRESFYNEMVKDLINEAKLLEIDMAGLKEMIEKAEKIAKKEVEGIL